MDPPQQIQLSPFSVNVFDRSHVNAFLPCSLELTRTTIRFLKVGLQVSLAIPTPPPAAHLAEFGREQVQNGE